MAPDGASASGLDFATGTHIAEQYEIVQRVGDGASSVVYQALDLTSKLPYALKFLKRTPEGEDLNCLLREIGVGLLVTHPHVCRLIGHGKHDGRRFHVMEYVDGEDIEGTLKRLGWLHSETIIRKGIQICLGLAAIHDEQLVHRDIKPANLRIDRQGNAKIMDFGTVAVGGMSVQLRGTPDYMSPQQWSSAQPVPSDDIYSLGLVLFRLFTGKPYLGLPASAYSEKPKVREIVEAHEAARRHWAEVDTGLSAPIDHIVKECLKPDRRPTADQLRKMLEAL